MAWHLLGSHLLPETSAIVDSGTKTGDEEQSELSGIGDEDADADEDEDAKDEHKGRKIHIFRYLDEFMSLGCCSQLIDYQIYPNCKEITEAFAVLNVLRTHFRSSYSASASSSASAQNDTIPFHFQNENVTAVVVGDGRQPRIAALLCFITRWRS